MSDKKILKENEKRFRIFYNNKHLTIISLVVIATLGIVIRGFYLPLDIPLFSDAGTYFAYANDLAILKEFPTWYNIVNNGWPTFLSFFFSIFQNDNFISLMNIQRILSVIISSLTVFPLYFLCRKFFDKTISIIGSALFIFEPRIIINSLLGITEPIYIILLTSSLFLFLNENKRTTYVSFALVALAVIVRYEAIIWFIVLSIMYFVLNRKEKKSNVIFRYLLLLGIFLLVLSPMLLIRISTSGSDQISAVLQGSIEDVNITTSGNENKIIGLITYLGNGIVNLFKYFAWITIPTMFFFIPFGTYMAIKNRNSRITVLMSIIIGVLFTNILYSYSRGIEETRYFYPLYPILIIFSLFTIKKIQEKFRQRKIIYLVVILWLIVSSLTFLQYKSIDVKHEKEAFEISKQIYLITHVINDYKPESNYFFTPPLLELKYPFLFKNPDINVKIVPTLQENSLDEFIKSNIKNGITHIVIDDGNNRPEYFRELLENDNAFEYLKKMYDSKDYKFNYHVKVFEIDFSKFNEKQINLEEIK